LAAIEKEKQLLSRDVVAIDLRFRLRGRPSPDDAATTREGCMERPTC
jgi:hypothetical protein